LKSDVINKSRVLLIDVGGSSSNIDRLLQSVINSIQGTANALIHLRTIAPNMDSANLTPEHWRNIADLILTEYNAYDGFVILHGADTLAYTASALSFLFENLGKPIVVTGPQIAELHVYPNFRQNLMNAVTLAAYRSNGLPLIPEVVVLFHDIVFRGNRTCQVSATSYQMFASPNCPPLGTITDRIIIRQEMIRPVPPTDKRVSLNNCDWEPIINLTYFPGADSELIRRIFEDTRCKGLILETYGEGNVPTRDEDIKVLQDASNNGKAVVLLTRSSRVGQLPVYESTVRLQKAGVILAGDLTREAAFAKLSLTLGRQLPLSVVRELFQYDLRGEQSHSVGHVEDLWLPSNDLNAAIVVANQVSDELVKYLARHPAQLHSLSSRNFEILVAEIFKHHGYNVALTPATRDGGYDFRALFVDGLGIQCLSLVEVKRYAPDNPVDVTIVRSLYGVVSAINAARGIIVTTSRFTKDAKDFQSAVINRISLYDYDDLRQWLLTL
jgi:L-asparaginase